ncbi:hypothetical protein FQR65_LT09845 [Abscondita terminalis]|nr:hypothetical protein FQR65_LT09845 [Abscondita terminalis]
MKKILSSTKLSTPSKLVRKVLSLSSSTNDSTNGNVSASETPTISVTSRVSKESCSSVLESEILSLKEQMAILKITVNSMHEDAEQKDKALMHLEKEKRELGGHLKKEKRSNITLKKQLQAERDFYYKEKEQYCQEMNECKKLKKQLSEMIENKQEEDTISEILLYKSRMAEMQDTLNATLEANYNLSVKFMKMKNTKSCLRKRLMQHDLEHKKAMEGLVAKLNGIKNDLFEVVDKKFTSSISSSNKKFLHVIKQNGILMYENVCLQMEIDKLNSELDQLKYIQFKKESRNQYKLLQKNVTTQTEIYLEDVRLKTLNRRQNDKEDVTSSHDKKIIKVFEKDVKEGVPHIIMLPEDLPGINYHDVAASINSKESTSRKINTESVSQLSTIVHCCSTRSTLRAQSSPDVIMSSTFVTKNKS